MTLENEIILIRLEGLEDRMIPATLVGGWPPPDTLVYDSQNDRFAFDVMSIPEGSPYVKYVKVRESELTDEQAEEATHVMRGAEYKVEGT